MKKCRHRSRYPQPPANGLCDFFLLKISEVKVTKIKKKGDIRIKMDMYALWLIQGPRMASQGCKFFLGNAETVWFGFIWPSNFRKGWNVKSLMMLGDNNSLNDLLGQVSYKYTPLIFIMKQIYLTLTHLAFSFVPLLSVEFFQVFLFLFSPIKSVNK